MRRFDSNTPDGRIRWPIRVPSSGTPCFEVSRIAHRTKIERRGDLAHMNGGFLRSAASTENIIHNGNEAT
jgi:hypothetical protein